MHNIHLPYATTRIWVRWGPVQEIVSKKDFVNSHACLLLFNLCFNEMERQRKDTFPGSDIVSATARSVSGQQGRLACLRGRPGRLLPPGSSGDGERSRRGTAGLRVTSRM